MIVSNHTRARMQLSLVSEPSRLGLNIENLLDTEGNEAQFDTQSRLFDEPEPVNELHYTLGTPFSVKVNWRCYF